uniref:Uncharacterized protein n=1 Tax=Parastrongyloides trichosuri TaxID=131310 RepID=A0A0N4ZR47_PARTI
MNIGLALMISTYIINCLTFHFVKRSFETGYSISAARPFAQPSVSGSENQRNNNRESPGDNRGNRIELTPRSQVQSFDENIFSKRLSIASNNDGPRSLPPLRHNFRPNTANRLPEN